jgi:hypothetical protein
MPGHPVSSFNRTMPGTSVSTDLLALTAQGQTGATTQNAILDARQCVVRFTSAFNRCDVDAMDRELHFPHVLLSRGAPVVWSTSGQHPPTFFPELRKTGWARTECLQIDALLAHQDKVHFLVVYERLDAVGAVLTAHENVWVVTLEQGRWGIRLRSY